MNGDTFPAAPGTPGGRAPYPFAIRGRELRSMTLRGAAAICGLAEFKPVPYTKGATTLGMLARVGMEAIADAGLEPGEVDGLVTEGFSEAPFMAASTVAEYMGLHPSFAEVVDHGGATAAAMVVRAASAIAAGLCTTVV